MSDEQIEQKTVTVVSQPQLAASSASSPTARPMRAHKCGFHEAPAGFQRRKSRRSRRSLTT